MESACEYSTLYATLTTWTATTLTTSTPIIITGEPTTSTWMTTSCVSTASAAFSFEGANLVAVSGATSTITALISTSEITASPTTTKITTSSSSVSNLTSTSPDIATTTSTSVPDTSSSAGVDSHTNTIEQQELVALYSKSATPTPGITTSTFTTSSYSIHHTTSSGQEASVDIFTSSSATTTSQVSSSTTPEDQALVALLTNTSSPTSTPDTISSTPTAIVSSTATSEDGHTTTPNDTDPKMVQSITVLSSPIPLTSISESTTKSAFTTLREQELIAVQSASSLSSSSWGEFTSTSDSTGVSASRNPAGEGLVVLSTGTATGSLRSTSARQTVKFSETLSPASNGGTRASALASTSRNENPMLKALDTIPSSSATPSAASTFMSASSTSSSAALSLSSSSSVSHDGSGKGDRSTTSSSLATSTSSLTADSAQMTSVSHGMRTSSTSVISEESSGLSRSEQSLVTASPSTRMPIAVMSTAHTLAGLTMTTARDALTSAGDTLPEGEKKTASSTSISSPSTASPIRKTTTPTSDASSNGGATTAITQAASVHHRRSKNDDHYRRGNRFPSGDNDDNGDSCSYTTITSTGIVPGDVSTSWSTYTTTTYGQSVLSVPTQTITNCLASSQSTTIVSSDADSSSTTAIPSVSYGSFVSVTTSVSTGQTTRASQGSIATAASSSIGQSSLSWSSQQQASASSSWTSGSAAWSMATESPSMLLSVSISTSDSSLNTSRSSSTTASTTIFAASATADAQLAGTSHLTTGTEIGTASHRTSTSASTSTASSSPSSDGSSSHLSKAVSTGAAIGGVIGLLLLLWAALFALRQYKRRRRVKRTHALRSSWFYGGDIPEDLDIASEGESEKRNSPPPQSRFSAPSLLSRTSLAVPGYLSRPISTIQHQTQRQSSRLTPILSSMGNLWPIRNTATTSAENNMGYVKRADRIREEQGVPRVPVPPWAEKYTTIPSVNDRRISPPIPIASTSGMMPNNSELFDMGTETINDHPSSQQQEYLPGHARNDSGSWGSSYASGNLAPLSLPGSSLGLNSGLLLPLPMPNVIVTAPTEANSNYSRSSLGGGGLSRSGTINTTWSRASEGEIIEPDSFPLPPITFPTSPPNIRGFISPPQDAPNFSRRDPHDSLRHIQSQGEGDITSGVWEYASYADAASIYTFNGGGRESTAAQRQSGGTGVGSGSGSESSTRNRYEKPLWDQSTHPQGQGVVDPESVYGVSVYSDAVGQRGSVQQHQPQARRISRKSVRWDDGPKVL